MNNYLKFFVAPNLASNSLNEDSPWDFHPSERELRELQTLPKPLRRRKVLQPETNWNVYTAVRGLARNHRISQKNPPVALRGLVADYDMVSDVEKVEYYLNQKPEKLSPNFIEVSLSNKIRLVWVFKQEILVPSMPFCQDLMNTFFEKLEAPGLLPGYDKNSIRPYEMWTNGGIWHDVNPNPLPWDYCFGVACEVGKKVSLFNNGEIPIEKIAAEVESRFPGRWIDEFKLDALGVRFGMKPRITKPGAR